MKCILKMVQLCEAEHCMYAGNQYAYDKASRLGWCAGDAKHEKEDEFKLNPLKASKRSQAGK